MRVAASNVQVSGVREGEIVEKLEFFYQKSSHAAKLIDRCGENGLTIHVHASGGSCECQSAKEIDLYWDDCHNEVREISESALFERNLPLTCTSCTASSSLRRHRFEPGRQRLPAVLKRKVRHW